MHFPHGAVDVPEFVLDDVAPHRDDGHRASRTLGRAQGNRVDVDRREAADMGPDNRVQAFEFASVTRGDGDHAE